MKRNFILLLLVIVLSVIFGYPIGYFVDHVFLMPGVGGSFDVGPGAGAAEFLIGILFAYSIFLPLIFIGWNSIKKWIWIIVGILPIILFFLPVDQGFIIFPAGFFLIGIILGFLTNWLKVKHPKTG